MAPEAGIFSKIPDQLLQLMVFYDKAVFLNPLEICSVSTKFRQKFLGDDWDLIDGSKKYIELDLDEIIELLTEVSTLRDANAALIKDRDRLILELTALRNRNAQP